MGTLGYGAQDFQVATNVCKLMRGELKRLTLAEGTNNENASTEF